MNLADVGLAPRFVEHFRESGIEDLYPPQEAAVEAGVAEDENVLAAVPTASGKTLIAQLAMLSTPGAALYVAPLRALASEKGEAFATLPEVSVGVATGDYESQADGLDGTDIVVATPEKVDSLIRNEESLIRDGGSSRGDDPRDEPEETSWLSELGCVVVDEVHLLNDDSRGPTLEMTLAKLRAIAEDLQVVALSATVANPDAIADWFDAALVETDWRPIDLRTGVYHDGRIDFAGDEPNRTVPGAGDPARSLIHDVLGDGGQCLVFVHSRRAAEELARAFAAEWLGTATGPAEEIGATARTDTGNALADCVRSGVAFHHAGVRPEHRSTVEAAFRDRAIDVVCATPTLAAGVNVPARRVVVRDHRRYTDDGRQSLPVLEVHQMFGRAGRPGLDPYGEAVVVAENEAEMTTLRERYIEGDPEAVTSKLATQDALRTHVLATVANGFATSREELLEVLDGTFYATQEAAGGLLDIADLLLDYLDGEGMIEREDGLAATDLGETVSRLYVDPETAAEMIGAFDTVDPEAATERTVLELVCEAPEVGSFWLRGEDRAQAYRFAQSHEDELLRSIEGFEGDFEGWLSTLKTVRVLVDWLEGAEEGEITDRHGIGPGDLRTKVERAEWITGAAESLAERLDSPLLEEIRAVREGFEARTP